MIRANTIDPTPAGRPRLVVIGNGMAGARLVEDVLALDRDRFDVVMFGDEPYGNYNRILLSNVLNGSQDPKEIYLNPLSWYEENNVTLHAGKRVTRVDRERQVVYADGVEEPYDVLVFATGSKPFVPPVPGTTLQGVFVFRTLDWPGLARMSNVVVYMGLRHVEKICDRLIDAGMPPDTPAAVVANATLPNQVVIDSLLSELAADVRAAAVPAPAVIVVGDAVRYRSKLLGLAASLPATQGAPA